MNRSRLLLGGLIAVLVLFFLTASVYTEWLWFRSLGYERLFFTGWLYRAGAGAAFGLFAFFFLALNIFLARKLSPNTRYVSSRPEIEQILSAARRYSDKYLTRVFYAAAAAIAVISGLSIGSSWESWLRYLSASPTGSKDPIFGRDISFYFFTVPIAETVLGYLFFLLLAALALAVPIHLLRGTFNFSWGRRIIYRPGATHVAVLLGLLMAVFSCNWKISAFSLLYSPSGAVYGAGYTDVHVLLPAYNILFVMGLAAAVLIVFAGSTQRWTLLAAGPAVVLATAVLGTAIFPWIVQEYRVTPNEIEKERPYIAYGIDFTRRAFGLKNVARKTFPVAAKPAPDLLSKNRDTIDNLRLWDWRPLQKTYSQLQEIRLYYKFKDVDLDRYTINGRYRQIALAAREMEVGQLPVAAQTWVNKHLVYTHGYGVVASPVNEAAGEGLPNFFIKNIPPRASTDLKVTRPQIYFGEATDDYAIVGTRTKEFDYPAGDRNKYTEYKGRDGVSLSNYFTKMAFAYRFGTAKLVLSDALTADSRILIHRNIKERVETLTPFIAYDSDPYVVIIDGKLSWIVDGYSVSSRYPYSKPAEGGYNYMRNSVKAVVDAYDGSVDFFISDKNDPMIKAYARAYPGTFKSMDKMDKKLRAHIRYPETLFKTQAEVFSSFHMTDPQVFYNKEDLWAVPQEIYESSTQLVEPYYVIMDLPGGRRRAEFALIMPFTPTNKNNMVSWLAASSDPPDYGKLSLYTFPKDKLVFGPLQIEARLNQDPDVSRELSLWDQRGSRVIRGNLLVIPIGKSVLYVEPIYLQAESGQLPELKRVAAGLGDKVVMEATLEDALAALTGRRPPAEERKGEEPKDDTGARGKTDDALISRAAEALRKAEAAQKDGDWTEYGRQLKILRSLLEQ